MKAFIFATAKRALHTFCEAALAFITVGSALSDINWKQMVSVSAAAAVYSILKSIVVGVPEAPLQEEE